MVRPVLNVSRSGLPVLSKGEMEALGDDYMQDFQPEMLTGGEPLRAEQFATEYHGFDVEYQYLSNNGCYLGAAILGERQQIVLYDPEANAAFQRTYALGTILLDATLETATRDALCRFTLLHECAHQILHRYYFNKNPGAPAVACRRTMINTEARMPSAEWTDCDRMEWQANYLSSCMLMPASAVRARVRECDLDTYCRFHIGRGMSARRALRIAAIELAPHFRVSTGAAENRLRALGFCAG